MSNEGVKVSRGSVAVDQRLLRRVVVVVVVVVDDDDELSGISKYFADIFHVGNGEDS